MKLSSIESGKYNAKLVDTAEAFGFQLPNGRALALPARFSLTSEDAEGEGFTNSSERGTALAVNLALELTHKTHTINADERLSVKGKEADLAHPRVVATQGQGLAHKFLDEHEAALTKEEAELNGAPRLTNSDHLDIEIDKRWWNKWDHMPMAERTALLTSVQKVGKHGDPKIERFVMAMLRDPLLEDGEHGMISNILIPAWRERQARVFPERAAALKFGLGDLDAARKNVFAAAHHVKSLTGYSPLDLYKTLKPVAATSLFFNPQQSAEFEHAIEHSIYRYRPTKTAA